MEKKTIGGFIAALRKANGLTQKQLAEKLCVSDKAVSRWERDECAPDLTLIPVIAEIFSISTDELLRGQRNNPDAAEPAANAEVKVQQQTKRLLKNTLTKYQTYSILCFGIALLGFLVALVCNFGFLRGPLGFILGCVCTAAAVVLEVIFTIEAKAALEDVEFEPELLNESRLSIFRICRNTAIGIALLFAMTLPLTMVYDTYMGITFESWILYSLLFAFIVWLLGSVISWILSLSLSKKKILPLAEKVEDKLRLRLRFSAITAAILIVLFVIQGLLNTFLPEAVMTGSKFETWESFQKFMETPMGGSWYAGNDYFIEVPIEGGEDYEDSNYNHETVTDNDGNILCEYTERNMSVRWIHYNFEHSDDGLPVTVYTDQDYRDANLIMDDLVNPLCIAAYAATILIALLFYCRKARQYR